MLNRSDKNQGAFLGYEVWVDGEKCASGNAMGRRGYKTIDCVARGSTVRLQMRTDGRQRFLNLQYVGVIGQPSDKTADEGAGGGEDEAPYTAKSSATMSSVLGDPDDPPYPAENCLEFSSYWLEENSMCATSGQEADPWIELRTPGGEDWDITSVYVQNNDDKMPGQFGQQLFREYEVWVDGWKCASGDAEGAWGTTIPCVATGSTVRLQMRRAGRPGFLNLQYGGVTGPRSVPPADELVGGKWSATMSSVSDYDPAPAENGREDSSADDSTCSNGGVVEVDPWIELRTPGGEDWDI
ncbi:MAG: hypothetical protein VX563_05985, partial [Planctomycetota bacterium]|nr:hypothetical protein [Planctomycetota bacterium]